MSMKQDKSSKNLIINSCDWKITMVHKIKFCPGQWFKAVSVHDWCKRVQANRIATVNQFQFQTAPGLFKSVHRIGDLKCADNFELRKWV
jgi:hypothetical protein